MPLHNQHENPVKSEIRSFLRQRKVTSDETDDKSALQMTYKWWLTIVIKEECGSTHHGFFHIKALLSNVSGK